jgi:hypothetical protein
MPNNLINGISLIGFMRALKSIMLGIRVVQASSTKKTAACPPVAQLSQKGLSLVSEQAESVQTI